MNGKHLGIAFVFAAGLATSLSAAQGTTQKAPPPKPSQTKTAKSPTAITGCLERNATTVDRSTVEPPGEPGLPAYKLTHVDANALKDVLDASKSSGMTDGQQTSASAIWLRAEGSTDLAAHVGHKVELTGKVVPETKKDEPPATSASSAAAAKRGVADHLPTFQVSSVKMIASSCQ